MKTGGAGLLASLLALGACTGSISMAVQDGGPDAGVAPEGGVTPDGGRDGTRPPPDGANGGYDGPPIACASWSECPEGWKCRAGSCVPFQWTVVGPGGGGTMATPRLSPHDPRTAIVSCDMTGAYLTHDGGSSWKEFNVRTVIGDAVFDPVDPHTVYAGSTGIFRSGDDGATWQLIFPDPASVTEEACRPDDHAWHCFSSTDNFPGGLTRALAIDPEDNARLYAVLGDGLWASTDRGAAWSRIATVGGGFVKLFIDPTTPLAGRQLYVFDGDGIRRLAVATGQSSEVGSPGGLADAAFGLDPSRAGSTILYVVSGDAVFRSDDRGGSWAPLGVAPSARLVGAAISDARTVWVATHGHQGAFGIMKSEDSGGSFAWALRETCGENADNMEVGWLEREWGPCWPGPPQTLSVAPRDPDVCYATDSARTYGTYDGGLTWKNLTTRTNPDGTVVSSGLDVTTTYGVHFDPFDSRHLVISFTDIGMFHSRDGGNSWRHTTTGVPDGWTNTCYWMVFDPEVEGRAWSVWSGTHDLPRGKMLGGLGGYQGGVLKTANGGESWSVSSGGMAPTAPTHIVLDPQSPAGQRTLYVAAFGDGVYKSTDDGATWSLRTSGIAGAHNGAWRITRTETGDLYLVVARTSADGALYKSTDAAASWQGTALPQGTWFPTDLVIDPEDPQRMYLSCWPRSDGSGGGGVYLTEDGGLTWSSLFDERYHVYGLALDPRSSAVVYLTTFWGAAFRSEDRGASFKRLAGFDFKWAHRPIIDPADNDSIYITTFGSSVWHGP
ncbi:MAG: hypothetical protein HY906_10650 [Deltaproteobacteria bacterium]|nr:hypothetical protein [Deltaproteobacteria bacterium]